MLVGFETDGEAPKVHDLLPEDVWTEILRLRTSLKVGLDEALRFRAELGGVGGAYDTLSDKARARVAVAAGGGAQMVMGPFQYSVTRAEVLGRGRENSEVFWRLDGQEYVQHEEPYLGCVLRVPAATEAVRARGAMIAYSQFDFLGADLTDWPRRFRKKLRSFFGRGIPLESTRTWEDVVTR